MATKSQIADSDVTRDSCNYTGDVLADIVYEIIIFKSHEGSNRRMAPVNAFYCSNASGTPEHLD